MTMFKGIRKLAPGGADDGRAPTARTEIETYWTPDVADGRRGELVALSEDELEERLLELLRESIAKRMMSDVPFGVFLSGGVDSSTNVALMSELMDDPVRTFSVALRRARAATTSSSYARQVAEHFGTDHHEVVIDSERPRVVPAGADLPPGRADRRLGRACRCTTSRSSRATTARSSSRSARAPTRSSTATRPTSATRASSRRYWEPFQRVPAPAAARDRPGGRRRSRAASGRGRAHAQAIEDAAEGRLPFWGGAIAYQGELKERVPHQRHARIPTPTRSSSGSGTRPSATGPAPTCSRR